ncbi:ATP-binding cassette domain-containing protein [Rhodococcus rhodnii]|nr:ABC transporter ATP-binding protein [Rhodococcus rhodnii]TXG89164.1 ATP-binding cassette domain-containing protein [Rhodococcus rhodnii]
MNISGTTSDTVISARDLRRVYGSGSSAFEAVRGVDFDVAEGEVFALLGTNGAGKTSTFDMLEGLVAPTSGEVSVFGRDPLRDRKEVRPDIGIVLQSGGLPAELTVEETLEMWRGTCTHPTTTADVLDKVAMTERAHVRVGSLSGGEKRRVDLACALVGQPRLLFLDEPTTGLDPENRRGTWQLLDELKAGGVTMILTTHYLDEAETLADRIAIMHRGEIARRGTLTEIVGDHPARIAFEHPGIALPRFDGADVDPGARVVITTHELRKHLSILLDWADHHRVALPGLEARSATLESVFLDIADNSTPASVLEPIGDPR